MSTEDDRRALEAYVAGVPVDPAVLARAVTARAIDRTIVVEALLRGLHRDEPLLRRRMATRIARMPHLDERVAARLKVLAGLDDDLEVREAAAEALRRHRVPVPGDPVPRERAPARRPFLVALGLRALVVRSAVAPITVQARYSEDAPDLTGRVMDDGHGGAVVQLAGLPEAFTGTRPVLRARRDPLPHPLAEIARASNPVSPDGRLTVAVPASVATFDELTGWMAAGTDLVVPDED
jgi:hypothetical protein